jgi:hypothetical protein
MLAPLFGPICLRPSQELPFNKEDGPKIQQLISDLIMDYNALFPVRNLYGSDVYIKVFLLMFYEGWRDQK